jgi:hypothetical protein
MALAPLSYLFCTEDDVFDWLSIDGEQLSLNDMNNGSSSLVALTADAAASAVSLTVAALPSALPRGLVLQFSGSDMTLPVLAQLAAAASLGATSLSVQPIAGPILTGAQAVDRGVSAMEQARVNKGIMWSTSRVSLYCQPRYDPADLATSWVVNQWTAVMAAGWVRKRRANPLPGTLKAEIDEAMTELRLVRAGSIQIPDIGLRNPDFPAYSNMRVDQRYWLKVLRVQRPISSQSDPVNYNQVADWDAESTYEW